MNSKSMVLEGTILEASNFRGTSRHAPLCYALLYWTHQMCSD